MSHSLQITKTKSSRDFHTGNKRTFIFSFLTRMNVVGSVFMAAPYILRAVRLIVAHSPEYRYKFARFIRWKPLTILWTSWAMIAAMETALVWHFM